MTVKSLDQHIGLLLASRAESLESPATVSPSRISAIWHERMGKSADEIATEYDLTLARRLRCARLLFRPSRRNDRSIAEGEAFAESLRQRTPLKSRQKLQEQKGNGAAG